MDYRQELLCWIAVGIKAKRAEQLPRLYQGQLVVDAPRRDRTLVRA
jgi:hypothetical protein